MLIVSLHVSAEFVPGTGAYCFYSMLRGLASIAIPYFCVVSGYFLAVRMGEIGWWRSALRKRVESLLIPFFIWNIIAWLFYAVFNYIAATKGISFGDAYVHGITFGKAVAWLGLDPFGYPLQGHYWYVRMLFTFVLVSPLFVVCRRSIIPSAILLASLVIFNRFADQSSRWFFFFEWTFPFRCLFFLSVGILLSNGQFQAFASRLSSRWVGWLSLAIGAILIAFASCGIELSHELRLVAAITLLFGVWNRWKVIGLPGVWLSCAFPVYTLHWFITRIIQIVLKACHQYDNTRSSFPVYIVSLLSAWIISLLLSYAMRKYLPKPSKFLFGR